MATFVYTDVSQSNASKFIDECTMVSKCDHPNVLEIIGVSVIPEKCMPIMIMPFMHNGDVRSYLKSKRESVNFNVFPKVTNYVRSYTAMMLHIPSHQA